jgi:hypothetical protein
LSGRDTQQPTAWGAVSRAHGRARQPRHRTTRFVRGPAHPPLRVKGRLATPLLLDQPRGALPASVRLLTALVVRASTGPDPERVAQPPESLE